MRIRTCEIDNICGEVLLAGFLPVLLYFLQCSGNLRVISCMPSIMYVPTYSCHGDDPVCRTGDCASVCGLGRAFSHLSCAIATRCVVARDAVLQQPDELIPRAH